jgi:hypothetical protein
MTNRESSIVIDHQVVIDIDSSKFPPETACEGD